MNALIPATRHNKERTCFTNLKLFKRPKPTTQLSQGSTFTRTKYSKRAGPPGLSGPTRAAADDNPHSEQNNAEADDHRKLLR